MLVLPADYFRAFHLQHHRFTQDRRRDPELAAPPLAGRRAYLWHVSGIPYWRDRFAATGRHALGRVTEDFVPARSEEHTSELQSLMRISYAVFCLKKKTRTDMSDTTRYNQTEHIEERRQL